MPVSVRSCLAFVLLSLLTGIVLSSCSGSGSATSPSGLPTRFPDHSAEQIRGQILGATDTIQSYRAKARVTVQSPNQNRTFDALVRHRRADSLFMRVSMFGFEGGRLLITPDSVFFFDSRKGVLRVGPAEAVRNIFPAPVSSEDFFQNMLGLIAPASGPNWSLRADSTLYYMQDPADRRRYVIDPGRWRVVRYKQQNGNGVVTEKRYFSNFRTVENVVLPARLVFRRPAGGLRAVVQYRDITLNPPDLTFSLDVPANVPRRPFSQSR